MLVPSPVAADARILRLPPAAPGLRVGLFGGSFNPPHEGHLLVAETALRRLELDRLWWIVTPGNPLKDVRQLAPLAERVALCRALANDRRMIVTAFEAAHRIRYTADMVDLVLARRPDARFVWVMGADGLAYFHQWQAWRTIADRLPIAVVDRPGSTLSLLSSPAARALWRYRRPESEAARLAVRAAPAWTFLHGPRSSMSSTRLRASHSAPS